MNLRNGNEKGRGNSVIFSSNSASGSAQPVSIRVIGEKSECIFIHKQLLEILPNAVNSGIGQERDSDNWRAYIVLPPDTVRGLMGNKGSKGNDSTGAG